MAQHDLPDGLVPHIAKKGEPSRNPTGYNGTPALRLLNRDIKALLRAGSNKMCDRPGFEHLTVAEVIVKVWLEQAMDGDRTARREWANRLYGRIPLAVDLNAQVEHHRSDLAYESPTDLADRVEKLAKLVRERETDLMNAEAEDRALVRAERAAEAEAKVVEAVIVDPKIDGGDDAP